MKSLFEKFELIEEFNPSGNSVFFDMYQQGIIKHACKPGPWIVYHRTDMMGITERARQSLTLIPPSSDYQFFRYHAPSCPGRVSLLTQAVRGAWGIR